MPGSLRTDGRQVYQLVARDDQVILQRVPVSGGDPVETPLPFAGAAHLLDVLPEEAGLLLAASHGELTAEEASEGRPLWLLPLPDGVPERLGGLVAQEADVSPDGRSLALVQGPSLLVASIEGSNPRELYRSDVDLSWVRWSRDGSRLRFTSPGPETGDEWIWEVLAAGGAPRPLWPGHMGDWTADGRYCLFDRPPGHHLFVVTEHPWTQWWPAAPVQLTSGMGGCVFWGSSRDSNRLVVSWGGAANTSGKGALLRFNPEGDLFEPTLLGESALYVEPSPDGKWLAWVRHPERTLWRSRPDGSDRLQLTRPPSVAYQPHWSLDGTRLVFVHKPDPSSPNEIRVVAADGSESEPIVRPESPGEEYWEACWLPDDSIILSRKERDGLFRFDPSTRRLLPVPGAEGLRYPKCSQKGDVWAFPRQLRRWGATEWRTLDASIGWGDWTRDGQSFCGITGSPQRISCLNIEDGRMTDITEIGGSPLEFSLTGDSWMGLDADGRPMVFASEQTASVHIAYWETP